MVASIVSFFQAFWGKIFLNPGVGRNIEWMRGVYNIGPKKLFLFLIICEGKQNQAKGKSFSHC